MNQGEFVGFDENYDPDYDADGDGYMSSLFGGSDCDDFNVLINPSEEELWYDGVDQKYDGFNDYDADMDGFATAEYSYGASSEIDCDDGNSNVNPDAEEVFMMMSMTIAILPMIMMQMVMDIHQQDMVVLEVCKVVPLFC